MDINQQLNLAGFVKSSRVNGPGKRAVVWTQGCPIQCRGCFNPGTWSSSPKSLMTVDELAANILAIDDIEGVTFSGGEPFIQARALALLGEILQNAGLNVIIFTGYTVAQVQQSSCHDWHNLLEITDLLIAGPFVQELCCDLPLRGSSNQQLLFLTDRLQHHADLQNEIAHAVEYIIEPDGSTIITGFPPGQAGKAIKTRGTK